MMVRYSGILILPPLTILKNVVKVGHNFLDPRMLDHNIVSNLYFHDLGKDVHAEIKL